MTAATADAASVQQVSSRVLIAVVLLSLVSSGLIVWLYVQRDLLRRLTALSGSMLAVAGGNLRVPLPPPDGGDEIAEMARALTVFRDTAVEIEDKGLREIEHARQRLIDAIESISEGFAFYDAEDRLQLCNTRYRELLYAGSDIEIEAGTPFEAILRRAVECGLIHEAGDDPERYVQQRLAQHRDPGPPTLQRRADGRWILIAERKVTGGGTVAVYSDITELKQREMELEDANRRTREAAEEIGRKHRELEVLSSKLAKYLSPQVYASIFAGRQEVKLASQRKKLTVFFSDIAGFTETTDKMESEDVTQLLNQYLTEMSRVALEYGATIDKYVGDAIMIFFGDPETRGVKEDALACVKMAIAMQKRMQELGAIWRDSRHRDADQLPDRHPHRLLHGRQFRQRGPHGLHDHRRCGEPRLPARARGAGGRHPDLVRDLRPCEGRDPLRGDGAHPGARHRPSGRHLPRGRSARNLAAGPPAAPRRSAASQARGRA